MGIFSNKSSDSMAFPSSEVSFFRLGPDGSELISNGEVISSPCKAIWMINTGNGGQSKLEIPITNFVPTSLAGIEFINLLNELITGDSEFPRSFTVPRYPRLSGQGKSSYSATLGYQDQINVGFNLFLLPNQEIGTFYLAKWSNETRLQFELVEFLKLSAPPGSELWTYLELITTNVTGIPTLLFAEFILEKLGPTKIKISIHKSPLQVAAALKSGGLKY